MPLVERFKNELWVLTGAQSRSISAENPRGEKGGGAKEKPEESSPARKLGVGWKARPCITLPAQETVGLADIAGPGIIRHIWMTVDPNLRAYRSCVLRMYWDEEVDPSVEVPLGDFFCNGHGVSCLINSVVIAANPNGGLNSYWPMPFFKSARITIENQSDGAIPSFFYQIDYTLDEQLPEKNKLAYFHAQWRRENPLMYKKEYTIVDGVCGQGTYVGTYLAWTQLHPLWWGEGEIKFFIDDDQEHPTICGTGTEDYACGAWGFKENFSHLYSGYPLWLPKDACTDKPGPVHANLQSGIKHGLYRWHIADPINFKRNLRVTIQALGWNEDGTFRPLEDDIASVAYWYQTEPHVPFPPVLPLQTRKPRDV